MTKWTPKSDFWRDRPVAVTGATGFLGAHLTEQLVSLGAVVTVLVRDDIPPTSISSGWLPQVRAVHGAVEDQGAMERLLGEYEIRSLFHLAAQSQVGAANRNPVSTFESNITGTWAVLEAARRSPRLEQVITASSDKAYGAQPVLPYDEEMSLAGVNPYDVSKSCADLLSQSYHATYELPVCITRCGNFFGPGDLNWERIVPGTARSLIRGESPIIRSDGTMVRDYLHVADGASAYLQLAEALHDDPSLAGEAFNFSTETPLTVLELVGQMQKAAGTSIEPTVLGTASHEIDSQFLSAAKARRVLGWEPSMTIEAALTDTIDWYRAHLGE